MPAQGSTEAVEQSGQYLDQMRADVRAGLTAARKTLPSKYFYDDRGSDLFDQITRLPEYYPTRAEAQILAQRSAEIAALARCESMVELGSGTSEKSRLLLDAMAAGGRLREFVPFDVDPDVLAAAAAQLAADYPGLAIRPVTGDFEHDLAAIGGAGLRMIVFLGSTIGNLEPPARARLLAQVAAVLSPGEMFLLGTDLVKDTARLLRAYDDQAGVTAEFNRNILHVINAALGADFAVGEFAHVAVWDAEHEWIEMRLRADRDQVVTIKDLDLTVTFAAGEDVRTEISAKFRRAGIESELTAAGLEPAALWTDPAADFALTLARRADGR